MTQLPGTAPPPEEEPTLSKQTSSLKGNRALCGCSTFLYKGVRVGNVSALTEEAASMALTAAWNTFLGSLRLVVPLSTMLLS